MPKIMFGSYQPDVASIDMEHSSYVNNVVPSANGYGPFKSLLAYAGALPARCLGAFGVLDSSNAAHIFAGTSTKLYKLDGITRAWSDVTRSSGGNYAVGSRELWSFELFGSNVVAVTDSNAPQVYTLGSSTLFAALGGSPPQARRVAVVKDVLVLVGLTANPNRIHWSGINDITGWTVGINSCDYQDFPDGGYTANLAGGEFGYVFQDRAIRRMVFDPVSDSIFDFSRVSDKHGLFMPYSLISAHGGFFFYSSDGFYRLDGAGGVTPIGVNRVDQTFRDDADLSNPRYMVGVEDPRSQMIMWAYKSKSNTSENWLDKVIIYDWGRNQWTPASINIECLFKTAPLTATLEGLDAVGTLDALPYSLDEYDTTPVQKIAGFDTTHKPGYFEGDALEAILDIPEATIGGAVRMGIRKITPLGDAATAYISTAKRDALNGGKTYSDENAVSVRGYAPQRAEARFLTPRLRIPAGATWTWARGMDIEAYKLGSR